MNVRDVGVVLVPRERYLPTLTTLEQMLEATPEDVPIVLVRGGMPEGMVRKARDLAGRRLNVVGPKRHLGPNEARCIGLEQVHSKFVVFVDNDVLCRPNWLEPLVEVANERDAWAVSPLVLQRIGDRVSVHEAGGECHLEHRGEAIHLVESQTHRGLAEEEMSFLATTRTERFEFHAVLFHRQRLIDVGGLDTNMLSTAEHLDVSLRIQQAGGSIWMEPSSRVVYDIPSKVTLRDLSFFLGRWSPIWASRTRDSFVAKYDIDPKLSFGTWNYPNVHRTYGWRFIARVLRVMSPAIANRRLVSRLDVVASRIIDRFFGRFVANALLVVDPRWRRRT